MAASETLASSPPSPSASGSSVSTSGGSASSVPMAAAGSGARPYVASRSMMSRNSISLRLRRSRHSSKARYVSGLSAMPPIIMSRPASMRLAMAISPSRESSSTLPISRRYMRTGSSVRPISASSRLPLLRSSSSSVAAASPAAGAFSDAAGAPSSGSSPSTRLMPISLSIAMVSSICSEDISVCGKAAFSSS